MKPTMPKYSASIARTLLDTFKMLPAVDSFNTSREFVAKTISEAYKSGYTVDPKCVNHEVYDMFCEMSCNYNATFYSSWSDIRDKSGLELLVDQLLHYISTYGTGYTADAYIPNENPLDIPFTELTVVQAVPIDILAEKCYNICCSGIAMSPVMIDACLWVLTKAYEIGKVYPLDKIANKEILAKLACLNGRLPMDPVEMFRCVIYRLTGETLLIKNKELRCRIMQETRMETLDTILSEFNTTPEDFVSNMAPIFNRFKPLFLAFKSKSSSNNRIINKIRRAAVTKHIPMTKGFFETITSKDTPSRYDLASAEKIISREQNVFKMLRAVSVINDKLSELGTVTPHTYIVRNGKAFTKTPLEPLQITDFHKSWLIEVRKFLTRTIISKVGENLRENGITDIILPEKIHLACPVSEKMFFGNIPYGSYYDMSGTDNFIGVYWRGEWGTQDFDLSFTTLSGKFGWNGAYRDSDRSLMFSGDMTSANPEAVEMFYAKDWAHNGLIMLNRYNGMPGSKAEIFYGQEEIYNLDRNYMVDPDHIEVRVPIVSTTKQQCVGMVYNGKAYFIDIKTGNSRVSITDEPALLALQKKLTSALFIEDILKQIPGLTIAVGSKKLEVAETPDTLDLRSMDKSLIIGLFSSLKSK